MEPSQIEILTALTAAMMVCCQDDPDFVTNPKYRIAVCTWLASMITLIIEYSL